MYQCQQALIQHLRNEFSDSIRTIDEYAGQIKDAHKLAQLCPAALVLFAEGRPLTDENTLTFDILVITLNRAHDKKKNHAGNLEKVSTIANFLKKNHFFVPVGAKRGRYEILRDEVTARTILNDNMFCIVALTVPIRSWLAE